MKDELDENIFSYQKVCFQSRAFKAQYLKIKVKTIWKKFLKNFFFLKQQKCQKIQTA